MKSKQLARLGLGAALALAISPSAFAVGTTAGNTITNNASVVYTVGSTVQPTITTTVGTGSDTFLVDRKVAVTVAEIGGSRTTVGPGTTAQVTTFTVTNASNAVLDFGLSVAQVTSPTDDFDVSAYTIYLDGGDNVYDGVDDVAVTYLDELPDTGAGSTVTVYVVADIPNGGANGDVADITLAATTLEGGTASSAGALVTANLGAELANQVDTVFGDAAGPAPADIANNGVASAQDGYVLATADVAISKSSIVLDDFISASNPKRIPGALLQYCISVGNTGSVDADSVSITDTIPTDLTIDVNSISTDTNSCDPVADPGTAVAPAAFAAGVLTVPAGTVAAGSSVYVRFQATIN